MVPGICASSHSSVSQDGGASAMLVLDARAGSSSARDDNPRIVRYVSRVAQVRETSPSSSEMDPSTCSKARVTPSLPSFSVLRSHLTLVVVRERLPYAVCARSARRCATPCYSLAHLFQRGMLSP